MAWTLDARIPVSFADAAALPGGVALLVEGDAAAAIGRVVGRFTAASPAHATGCACCLGRSSAAEALGRLFLAHARGEIAALVGVAAVTATQAGRQAVLDALATDPMVQARFRRAT